MKDCKCKNKGCKCELLTSDVVTTEDRVFDGESDIKLTEKDSIEYNSKKLPKLETANWKGEMLLS